MKTVEEILKRSVTLLSLTDRSALENYIINGVKHPLAERENQRCMIMTWLKDKGYYSYLTSNEREMFETHVSSKANLDILNKDIDHECIEPLLWSIGLVANLSNYDGFVIDDFHPVLQIDSNHNQLDFIDSMELRSLSEIEEKYDLAMLWNWRCIEHRRLKSQEKVKKLNLQESSGISNFIKFDYKKKKSADWYNGMVKCFGNEIVSRLIDYPYFDWSMKDFIVKGKPVSSLNDREFSVLGIVAEKRLYAFEWLLSNEDWEHVGLIS